MKRIANLLTVFVAAFIFMFFYQNISSAHYNLLNNFVSSFQNATDKHHITIEYELYDDEGHEVFHKLLGFLENTKYDALSINQSRRYDFILDETIYLYTEADLNGLGFFKSKRGKSIDFTISDNSYYSSHASDAGATDIIDYVNPSYRQEFQPKKTIRQFKSMLGEHKGKTAFIFLYSNDLEQLVSDVEASDIFNHIVSDPSFSFELAEPEALNIEAVNILLLLSISSLIIVTICELIGQKKEITIRKLFGEKDSSIYYELIAKRYVLNLFLYIAVQLLLYGFIVKGVRPIHNLLLKPLLLAFGIYIAFLIIANLISYHVLRRIGRVSNLKRDGTAKFANLSALALKVILIVLMVTPFINLFIDAPLVLEENVILRKNKINMLGNLAIEGVAFADFDDSLGKTLSFFEGLEWVYHDFSKNYLPQEVVQSIPEELYKKQFVQHPYIVANLNYLKDYDIRDLDGKPMDLNALEHNTLLVPKAYKDDIFTNVYYQGPKKHTAYIQDGEVFYNNYPLVPDLKVLRQRNPVILFVKEIDSGKRWDGSSLSVRDKGDTQKKVNDFLAGSGLESAVYITNMDNVYRTSFSRSNSQVYNFVLVLCLYVLMIFVFQYQLVYVYFAESKQEITLNYLYGKTYFQRYGTLILNGIAVHLLPLVIGVGILKISYKYMLLYMSFGITLDYLVATAMIRFFEKKKTLSVLKGE